MLTMSCREVVDQADALLAHELPWRQRLALRIHLLACVHCRRYLRQLEQLIRALFHLHGPASEDEVRQVLAVLHNHEANRPQT